MQFGVCPGRFITRSGRTIVIWFSIVILITAKVFSIQEIPVPSFNVYKTVKSINTLQFCVITRNALELVIIYFPLSRKSPTCKHSICETFTGKNRTHFRNSHWCKQIAEVAHVSPDIVTVVLLCSYSCVVQCDSVIVNSQGLTTFECGFFLYFMLYVCVKDV